MSTKRIPFLDDAVDILTGEAFDDIASKPVKSSVPDRVDDGGDSDEPSPRRRAKPTPVSVKRVTDPATSDEEKGPEKSSGGSKREGDKPGDVAPGTSDK